MSALLALAAGAALGAGGLAWTLARARARAAERARLQALADVAGVEERAPAAPLVARSLELADHVAELRRRAANARAAELRARVAEEELARLRGVFEALHDGVLVFEEGERISGANAAARRLLRCAAGTAPTLGRSEAEPALLEALRAVLGADLARGVCARKVELARDGARATYRVRGLDAAVRGASGPSGPVVLLEDITYEESSARMRAEFVYGVSHELKTPLTSIQACLEMLVEDDAAEADEERGPGVAPEDRARLLHLAHGESVRLARMIHELLELARVEAGIAQVRRERVEMGVLLQELRAVHAPLAQRKSIELDWCISPYVPSLRGDREQLRQAFVNLIGNAIKYTPEGGRIALRSSLEGEELVVSIADSGIGIGPEDLPRIFDKFFRASQAQSSRIPGTGLGLPLARYLIESHGGRIDVRSALGEGSTFLVRLPVPSGVEEESEMVLADTGGWTGGAR
jgi:two-component system phosphate regulon sensor histidine kinase PhoR